MSRRKCKLCGGQGISRSYCRICDDYYCNYCRPLPIKDMKCPAGHQFIKRNVEAGTYNCDICELTPVLLGFQVYDDFICNLGFCEGCFKNLPTFEHSVDYTQNMYNFCQLIGNKTFQNQHSKEQFQLVKKEHMLRILPKRILAQCKLCQKETLCFKQCIQCKCFYCFQCKKILVMGNQVCELEHPFQKIEESKNSEIENGQGMKEDQQKNETCYSCNKFSQNSESFFIDKQCKTVFCYQCIQKLKYQYFDIHLKCFSLQISQCKFKNHPLFILNFQHDFLEECCCCQKSRIIKSLCCMCQKTRFFCAKCVPPNQTKNCYCLKPLKKEHQVLHKRCLKCWQIEQGGFGCNNCSYVICGKCFDT